MSMIMQWNRASAADGERIRSMAPDDFLEWLEEPGRQTIDVDKAWQGIHFVLTGTAWDPSGTLGGVVLGGEELGEDNGYGPSRWLAPEEVARLAAAMAALTPEQLAERVDFDVLAASDVYPGIWDRADEREDNLEYLVEGYRSLRDGFAEAAAAGDGFVVSLL